MSDRQVRGCCDEPECRRKQPVHLMRADFSGKWFVVTKSEPAMRGRSTMLAKERHELPVQEQLMLDGMRNDSRWLRGVLAAMDMTKEQLAEHLEVVFHDV